MGQNLPFVVLHPKLYAPYIGLPLKGSLSIAVPISDVLSSGSGTKVIPKRETASYTTACCGIQRAVQPLWSKYVARIVNQNAAASKGWPCPKQP
jgi:hypothetical protein